MNSKCILTAVCIITCFSLLAGRKLSSLDGFRDVEIMEISPQGISIIHQSGACILTEEGLSEKGKLMLKDELAEVQKLQAQYQEQQERIKAESPQGILSRFVFPSVNFEGVSVKTAIRHLLLSFQRDSEIPLSYAFARDIDDCKIKFFAKEKNLFELLNLICSQTHLKYYFEKNYLYFYREDQQPEFLPATTGNREADQKLSQIIFPRIEMDEADYSSVLRFLDNSAIRCSDQKEQTFTFSWESNEEHMEKFKITCSFVKVDLLFALREICRLGSLEMWYADGTLHFSPRKKPSIEFDKGKEHYAQKDYKAAFDCFSFAASRGYAQAQYFLGLMYLHGDGIPKDTGKAFEWVQKAAMQGDILAQYSLGLMYDKGDGVKENPREALTWFRKAALQGDPDAQYLLGFAYGKGDILKKDYNEAIEWLKKAAKQDHEGALIVLKKLGISKDSPSSPPKTFSTQSANRRAGQEPSRSEIEEAARRLLARAKGIPEAQVRWVEISRTKNSMVVTGGKVYTYVIKVERMQPDEYKPSKQVIMIDEYQLEMLSDERNYISCRCTYPKSSTRRGLR